MIIYWQYLGMKTATPTLVNGFVPVPAIVSVYSEIVLQARSGNMLGTQQPLTDMMMVKWGGGYPHIQSSLNHFPGNTTLNWKMN